MKRFVLALIPAAFLLFSCNQNKEVAVTAVNVTPATVALTEGESRTLQAVVSPTDATDQEIVWSSSQASVATVTEAGVVNAVSEGTAVISARCGGKTGSCAVTVSKKYVKVSSLTLSQNSLSLKKGEKAELSATVLPADATEKTVTWSSSNEKVVTVSQKGAIQALAGGSAVITAQSGEVSAQCTVTVIIPVTYLLLFPETLTIEEEQTATLIATVQPADATDQTVSWESSAPETASVGQDGKVTGVKPGSAVITAKAGDCTATCVVTVEKKPVPVSAITLDHATLSLSKGESVTLSATVSPADATDPTVSWTSSNKAVATVTSSGKVTAISGGTAVITAKAGDITATCAVTVNVPVESVQVEPSQITLVPDQACQLVANVFPADATDKTVTWTSSDNSVASVDAQGNVTAIKGGAVTITATAGGVSGTCAVIVEKDSNTEDFGETEGEW